LLGSNYEIGDCTVAVARRQPENNRNVVLCVVRYATIEQQQRKNVSTEAEDIVEICRQTTTGRGTAD
jgi:hypothetical protein